jgi:UPF0716 protein FxsA
MFILVLAAFIVVPILELWLIIEVGGAIGVLPTLGLLILDSILGWALLRSQGRQAWERFNAALAERRPPAREVFDGAMIILGGALLLTPGFITDVFGLLLLIPPTRAAVRAFLTGLAKRRWLAGRAVFWTYDRYRGSRAPQGAPDRPAARPYDVDGTAREVRDESYRLGERHGES